MGLIFFFFFFFVSHQLKPCFVFFFFFFFQENIDRKIRFSLYIFFNEVLHIIVYTNKKKNALSNVENKKNQSMKPGFSKYFILQFLYTIIHIVIFISDLTLFRVSYIIMYVFYFLILWNY
jgi:hypothetical protein